MGVSKKLRTPIIKPRRQGGTFYTFSSALEDIGLNINELKNKVALSHYVLLDIPAFTADASLEGSIPKEANIGDYSFAAALQNYALNMETVLRNQSTYNFAESLTVSERVFWKFLKKQGLIEFVADAEAADSSVSYYVNSNDVVKGFGAISAGAQRSDAYGIYNETFVQIPSSFGKMKTLFKVVSDKNYHLTPSKEDYFLAASTNGLIENINIEEVDASLNLHTGIPATAIYDFGVDGSVGYMVSGEDEELCVEFSLSELRNYYGDETLSYDSLAMEGIGLPEEELESSYTFNSILVYYSIYDSTGKNILATNAYGLLVLDSAVPDEYGEDESVSKYKFPSIEKKKTTLATAGTSYAFRLNVKTSSVYSGDVTVCDDSTPGYEMSTEFNDVLRNLTAAIETLKSNANVIRVISTSNSEIKKLAMNTLGKIDDIEKDIANIKTGVSRHIKANYATIANLDTSTMVSHIAFFDRNGNDTGCIDGSLFNMPHIVTETVNADTLDCSIINTEIINTLGNELAITNGKEEEYIRIKPDGIYSNQELFLKSNADSIITENVDDGIVNAIFEQTSVLFDASTYVLKLPELSSPETTGTILKSLYMPISDDSNVVDSDYTHFNASSMLMLMISQISYLSNRVADLESKLGYNANTVQTD